MSEARRPIAVAREADQELSPEILSKVVEETARQVEARAARPSPIRLKSLEEIERFAERASCSGIVPKDYAGKPDACVIAIQLGSELGLAPMQALINIAVIGGRPCVFGDALPGLCRSSGLVAYIKEWHEGDGDTLTYYCEARRKDDPNPIQHSFSVSDAKTAKLWGKKGYQGQDTPWVTNPGRMLQMRARGFCLRDAFPDVLKGLISAEEASDIPFEDTGIKLPSVATQQMMKPATKAPEDGSDYPQLYEENGTIWLKNLDAVLAQAATTEEVIHIEAHPNVLIARKKAPTLIRGQITDMFNAAYLRFSEVDAAEDAGHEAAETQQWAAKQEATP